MGRGQTATEYMVLSAVVLVVVAILVGLLVDLPAMSSKAPIDKAQLQTQQIGILDHKISTTSTKLILTNNGNALRRITQIRVNNIVCDYSGLNIIAKKGELLITCTNVNATGEYNYPVSITYSDLSGGGTYTVDFPVNLIGNVAIDVDAYDPFTNFEPPVPFSCNALDSTGVGAGIFFNGTGTVSAPYGICNCTMLQNLNQSVVLGANATLLTNVDCSATSAWNGGSGFSPIGTCTGSCDRSGDSPYVGRFFGQGFTITGLYQNWSIYDGIGLFGNTVESSSVYGRFYNIGLENEVYGKDHVGGLLGYGLYSTVSNSYTLGVVSGGVYTGGLIGFGRYSTISNSYSTANVSGTTEVGGLAGHADGTTVEVSYATGTITGTTYVGGLLGYDSGTSTVDDSYFAGALLGTNYIGGIVSWGPVTDVTNSNSTGTITGVNYVGGITGYAYSGSDLNNVYTNNTINGSAKVGGLVGESRGGAIIYSDSSATVTGTTHNIGGLIGWTNNAATIDVSFFTGTVDGEDNVGGLIGYGLSADVDNSYSTQTITGTRYVGGIVGFSRYGTVTNSYSSASVTGTGIEVGGLLGHGDGSIINYSYATGTITGDDEVGGIMGRDTAYSSIDNSYFSGAVSGVNDIGGIIGFAPATEIRNSNNSGSVTGTDGIGGIAGQINFGGDTFANVFSSGNVSGSNYVGGLIGSSYSSAILTNSYTTSNVTCSGSQYCGGLIGFPNSMTINPVTNWTNYTTDTATGCVGQSGTLVGTNYTNCVMLNESGEVPGEGGGGPFACDARTSSGVGAGLFFNGSGTVSAPYGICNCTMLQDLNQTAVLGANATLLSDVDCSDTINWNGGAGFSPIGTCTGYCTSGGDDDPYTGRFFGQGYNISGLYQYWTGVNGVGLFGNGYKSISEGARIYDTTVDNNVSGANYVGGLLGYARYTNVTNSYSSGATNGTYYVGGLVGKSTRSNTSDSSSTSTVTGSNYMGGLVGYAYQTVVSNSYATGSVTGGYRLGGLIGQGYYSTILSSYANGFVNGNYQLGGLVGYTSNIVVDNSYATGDINGTYYLGGLLGQIYYYGTVSDSWSTGTVNGTYAVAGFIGEVYYGGNISNSYTTSEVYCRDGATGYCGGLVGSLGSNTPIYQVTNWTNYTTDIATGCIGQTGTLVGTDFTPAENCTTIAG